MMTRLETMILMGIDMPVAAIRQQLTSAIDIIIHLGRLRDKTRRVLQIAEVVGVSRGEVKFNKLFEFAENAESNGLVLGELKAIVLSSCPYPAKYIFCVLTSLLPVAG